MRNSNKKLILLVIFVLLLGVAFVLHNPGILPLHKKTKALFPGFAKKKIDRIEMEKNQRLNHVLVKQDGRWVVENKGGFPAEQDLVESILTTVSQLQKEELVGKSKANHVRFGVDPSASSRQGGLRVKLSGKGKSYELIVGGRGPEFASTYFRRAGENEVYLADQNLDLIFGKDDYRDLQLKLKVKSEKVKVINIKNENGETELEKKDDKWILTKPEEKKDIVQSRVEDLVSRLTTLEAADATSSASLAEAGLNKPTIKVKVKSEGAAMEDTLTIGGKNESGQRYAQVSGSPYIYLLAPSSYGTLTELSVDYFEEK